MFLHQFTIIVNFKSSKEGNQYDGKLSKGISSRFDCEAGRRNIGCMQSQCSAFNT